MNTKTELPPRSGMFATVRNRRGVIAGVDPFDGPTGRLHLVHLEYKDDQHPLDERLLWELEPRKQLLEPTALPDVASSPAMSGEDFDALLRATRWTACTPYLDPDGDGPVRRLPIASPFHGAVQIEDYQLVPLLKALRMPRVSLLIADDVGLGKTIEAGLILTELLLRRRIQRVLILTPASLRLQWKEEMWDKFSLPFDLVDRDETHNLRKRLGMDANPWRSFSRIVASYHYLRQDDVLEQFLAACKSPDGSPHLPWDLLIVDEVHNLMPSAFGEDSDLCRMLRVLSPQFEHRLFLSATPHNGRTRCYTGLLEMLDPVRFSQTDEIKPAERERARQVVLRRLKREINARTNPPKFCNRLPPRALTLRLGKPEAALSLAFDEFRKAVRKQISVGDRRRRRSGTFAIEILGKRLLSCPTAFAESWRRCREGLDEATAADDAAVASVERSVRQDTGDDREAQSREATAAGVVGKWLKIIGVELKGEIAAIDQAIEALGLKVQAEKVTDKNPVADARFEALQGLVEELLRQNGKWRDDERLLVFTEYKTTLDYLKRRLRERYEEDRILTLFGGGGSDGMDDTARKGVKEAFNDPDHKVRILVATDAAAEGLNLQRTARYILHFDCPWNPSRLEQRNGRVDRHGQARDVTVHHFMSDQDDDLRFLAHVIRKADEIREDLGSANELFAEAAQRRLVEGDSASSVQLDLDRKIVEVRGTATLHADDAVATGVPGQDLIQDIGAIAKEIDLDGASLFDTLDSAMSIRAGRPQLVPAAEPKTFKLVNPGLAGWSEVIDESLRAKGAAGAKGPVVKVTCSPEPFIEKVAGRDVFAPRKDVHMLHLSHPMLQKATASLTRLRFPGTDEEVSRWTVRLGGVPDGVDAVVLLHLEELAVNGLRESFHHWVRTVGLPVRRGKLGSALAHRPAQSWRGARHSDKPEKLAQAREIAEEFYPDLRKILVSHAASITKSLISQLELDGVQARKREDERYRSRQGEISSLIAETTIARLEREIEILKAKKVQGFLWGIKEELDELDRSIEEKQKEVQRRRKHYEEVREQLDRERDRVLKHVLPKRFALAGSASVFPVCVEIRLPGGAK